MFGVRGLFVDYYCCLPLFLDDCLNIYDGIGSSLDSSLVYRLVTLMCDLLLLALFLGINGGNVALTCSNSYPVSSFL